MNKFFGGICLFCLICANCFASTAVYDYNDVAPEYSEYLDINEVYVTSEEGCDVKEKPNDSSQTITTIPPNTPVRLVSINGPKYIEPKYGTHLNWGAVYLPEGARKGKNQIGWIRFGEVLWWDKDGFSTEKWNAKQLKGYLENHVWSVTLWKNGDKRLSGYAVFDNKTATGIIDESNNFEVKKLFEYTVLDGQSIELEYGGIIAAGTKQLRVSQNSFSISQPEGEYIFETVNLSIIDKENLLDEPNDYNRKLVNWLIKESKKYFRMYSECNYSPYGNLAEYAEKDRNEIKNNFLVYAVTNGLESENSFDTKFWYKIVLSCEKQVKKGNYVITDIPGPGPLLIKSNQYLTKERLRLRESEQTSSEIITTMDVGTKVQVIDYGSAEVIDGILSLWVKVRVIGVGTIGWCFGGYLSELDY